MHWDDPILLLVLCVLPVAGALLVHAHRKQRDAAARFAEPLMRGRLLPLPSVLRQGIKGTILLAGLALSILAAAGPRFGSYRESISQRGVDLMVLLDVSRSMTAEDVAPNRLERAKSDIRDLLSRLPGDRVGLIVFAGKPALKVPLTTDQELFRAILDEIDTTSAPHGGTRIGDAIRQGLQSLPKRTDRDQALVLITDGEDQGSRPEEAAGQAALRQVKILAVGLGDSREGARIPVAAGSIPARYAQNAPTEHWSKLNETLLKRLALATNGAYVPAGTHVYDLGEIYEDHLARLSQGNLAIGEQQRYRQRYQLFLALGLLLLAVEMGISGPGKTGPSATASELLPDGRLP